MSKRKYGHLPRQIYPLLPDAYDVLKKYVRISPYRVLGEMFGMSHQRIQQVVIAEREKQNAELVAERPPQVSIRPNPPRNQPGTISAGNQDQG
jgi:hypothetical protein